MHDVTTDIIASCGSTFANFAAQNITYPGGGSGVGAVQMGADLQQVSPMSRALKNTEYCAIPSPASPGLTADLLVGIDGVAIVANSVNSCTTAADGVTPTAAANGFGKVTSFTTSTGTYTFADSFDALKVLYFGLTNDGVYNCASPTRKALITQWTNLFQNDCGAGDGTCNDAIHTQSGVANVVGGLTHAWRRSDLSGTTDAFVNILNPPGRGVGTLPGVPGAATKVIPFCNAVDATTGVASFAGSSDFADNDPIRTECAAGDQVCGFTGKLAGATGAGSFQGDLGVVLPILIPDGTVTKAADLYNPNVACTNVCELIAPIAGAVLPGGYKCPDGSSTIGGACLMPVSVSGDPHCIATPQTQCASATGRPDGRRYNLVTLIPPSQVPAAQKAFRATTPFQFAYDIDSNFISSDPKFNPRFMTGSFHRIHTWTSGAHNTTVAGETNGHCQENDDTSQIGCLVDADPCSVGYAGREAAKFYPGSGVTGNPADSAPLKAFAVSASGISPFTPPFTPASVNSNRDEGLLNLLTTASGPTEPFYPLSRRLYFATLYGFGNLLNGEKELARCYANNSILTPSIQNRGFVAVPGGVECLDYPENITTTSAPAPNVRGSGNVALAGCNTGLTNNNSCLNPATAPDICGDGITTPDEGCDDGNTVSGDGCSATCTVEAGFTCTGTTPSVCTM